MHTSPLAALGGKETGGMNVYVRELSRALAARGWQVDAFTRWQDRERPRVQSVADGAFRVVHIAAGPVRSVDRRELYPFVPEFVDGVQAFAKEQGARYDLIHSHYWLSGAAARPLADIWGVPVIQMFHTLGRMKERVTGSTGRGEADNRALVEQEILSFADRVVAATPLDRQQILGLYDAEPGRITVVPCGVDLDLFRPSGMAEARHYLGIDGDRQLILFVGRLDPVKGLHVLLEAMCDLSRRMHPCRAQDLSLAVIGGDRESHLEALTSDLDCLTEVRTELGLEDLVLFIGSLDQEVLPYYYSAAAVCVMPSLYESFGMVALEAMACGTPVIASRVGGLQYTVKDGETGFLVPEQNPGALADKLEVLLNDEALRQRMGRRAIEVAAAYGWNTVADAMIEIYAELGVGVPV